jgi:hypothetical protein
MKYRFIFIHDKKAGISRKILEFFIVNQISFVPETLQAG